MEMNGEPRPPFERHRHKGFRRQMPPPLVNERDILSVVVLVLMFGANLGIKGYFRSRDDRKRLAELEHQNLEQQLAYLRYQVSPHFFMNTLNNIHALVDIDPQKAQETIVELSKMMRYVLYEGEKKNVPLTKEMAFLRTYITLMQLRYTNKVSISLDLPSQVPDRSLPPLLLISFVENAFKHGVSYQRESFIEVKVAIVNDVLMFTCRNSKADVPNDEKGGVGLTNVRKRLNLLYDHDYSLSIRDDADVYTVELNIPLS
jgi:LytS/YehU family sensor histidine kinase